MIDRYTVVQVTSWRKSRAVAAIAVAAFLALQLAVPISRLGTHESAPRFAWQMFSTAREAPEFVVETDDGARQISLGRYMAGARGDVDIEGLMPPHLCELFPEAERVTWQWGEHEC